MIVLTQPPQAARNTWARIRPRSGSHLALCFLSTVLLASLTACEPTSRRTPLFAADRSVVGEHRDVRAAGKLGVLAENPRYFSRQGERHAVYLTGSHTWNNFQDWGLTDPPHAFDYSKYLDFLGQHGHNFIRLYVWEQAAWFPGTEAKVVIAPSPYLRTGPGKALDGRPRFDLTQFNPAYFQRLRDRVAAAGKRGIYVSVMLFDGWSVGLKGQRVGNPWRGHPFNAQNNINGVNGDLDGDGEGPEVHTLADPAVTALQRAYVREVVETLSGLDNVLWEISNESDAGSRAWQYEMIRTISRLESSSGSRHPVGMTPTWPSTADQNPMLLDGPADWISPYADDKHPSFRDDPPAATGRKVIVADTDHLWGIGGSPRWVWKTLFRGMYPIFMDPYVTAVRSNLPVWPGGDSGNGEVATSPTPEWEAVRKAMGYARAVAERVDLASMRPAGELASSGYCLAAPGREYLVYLPSKRGRLHRLLGLILDGLYGERVAVDVAASDKSLDVEWIDVERGEVVTAQAVPGGRQIEFRAPFAGDAVLHLRVSG